MADLPPAARPSVLIVSLHSEKRYSGGRYHAWIMGEALAAAGCDVTVWTNEMPLLRRDFENFPASNRISIIVDSSFAKLPAGRFHTVILVPHLGNDWRVFTASIHVARRDMSRLVLLNFETPNWYNSVSPRKRDFRKWRSWKKTSKYCDVILSSAHESTRWAKAFYRDIDASRFQTCYPAINTIAADDVRVAKGRQIVCITRMDKDSRHKGADFLLHAMVPAIAGYRFVIIGGLDEETTIRLQKAAIERKIQLIVKSGITDLEKFKEIKKSEFMVFLSAFEGFGYPPAESLYCNVPCIANDLPVLRETCEDGPCFVSLEKPESIAQAVANLMEEKRRACAPLLRKFVADKVSFESYVGRMTGLLQHLGTISAPAALRPTAAEHLLFQAEGWVRAAATLSYRRLRSLLSR